MTKLSIVQVLLSFFLSFLCFPSAFALEKENNDDVVTKAPAPRIHFQPQVRYVENPDNQPGITDNYTLLSILSTDNSTIESEIEHIQEHLLVDLNTKNMTNRELEFHYFKMFDTDSNQKLDGTEILKSKIHIHTHATDPTITEIKIFTDNELAEVVDTILSTNDANNDGYIDYPEFIVAQQNNGEKHVDD